MVQTYASIVRTSISDHYALYYCEYVTKKRQNNQNQGMDYTNKQCNRINNYKVNKYIRETKWNEI